MPSLLTLVVERTAAVLGRRNMSIRSLLETEGGVFAPQDITALVSAFEGSLKALGLTDRNDPAVLMVAKRLIALANGAERDPIVLQDRVVKSFSAP